MKKIRQAKHYPLAKGRLSSRNQLGSPAFKSETRLRERLKVLVKGVVGSGVMKCRFMRVKKNESPKAAQRARALLQGILNDKRLSIAESDFLIERLNYVLWSQGSQFWIRNNISQKELSAFIEKNRSAFQKLSNKDWLWLRELISLLMMYREAVSKKQL